MNNKATNIIAAFFLSLLFFVCFLSIQDDVYTFDETAHVVSGYTYLTKQDYRLNPEHPPLIKDLAALPLLFLNLNFPNSHPAWIQEGNPVWWLQFDIGNQFIYHSGNNPETIMLWSKIPMILFLVFLGWFLFFWTKQQFGNKAALIALFLFCFSPTLIAHGRLVTTDIGAAAGLILATYFWLKFLNNPNQKNIILAGIILGLSLLTKFSLILLIPFFGIITIAYALINKKVLIQYILKAILAGVISILFVVWPIYAMHTINYPAPQQIKDTTFYMETSSIPKPIVNGVIWMSKQEPLRPVTHYITGLMLAANRAGTGNTTYFIGQISADGQKAYFPTLYLIKEPLPFHILSIISIIFSLALLLENRQKRILLSEIIKRNFTAFSLLLFIAIYWITSLTSQLNIGIRHLMPIFPPTIMLISATIATWLERESKLNYGKKALVSILILWQIISIYKAYPHFIAYFNELIGGSKNGHKYAVDSNLDWGQDLKRFKKWADENGVEKFYADYFGGGDIKYYFGDRYEAWDRNKTREDLGPNSYLVISMSQLKGGQGHPDTNFTGEHGYYSWIEEYTPITIIGNSIAVFYFD